VAINARQNESDTSNFHFIDNLSRAIRHGGRILLDLIPKVYNTERIIRVLGPDGSAMNVPLKQSVSVEGEERIFDLGAGRYDLVVSAGPSFASRREEAAAQMTELIRVYPAAAPILGDLLVKNMDWPESEEVSERLHAMLPPQLQQGGEGAPDPQMVQAQQAMQQMQEQLQALTQELQAEKQDKALEAKKLEIEAYKAETERMQALQPEAEPQLY
jgi:hypothetical protein